MRALLAKQKDLLVRCWINVDNLAATTLGELYVATDKSEQSIVTTFANIFARVHFRAALTNQDCAGIDERAVKHFYAEALRI